MICAIWAIPNLSDHFKEIINLREGITWCSVDDDVQSFLSKNHNLNSSLVSAGVSKADFYPKRKITQIKRLGLNGSPFTFPEWDRIKRPQMLIDIAKGIGGEAVFISGKSLDLGGSIYDDIDMYVCTSTNDRGPFGIAEAAFCKIPVLSTKTGLALRFKSIKTFDTTDEAIEIIKYFNENPKKLDSYVEDVYKEITEEMDWDYVAQKYWVPIFERHQSLNNR